LNLRQGFDSRMLAAAVEEGVEVYPDRGRDNPLIGEIAQAVGGWAHLYSPTSPA